MLPDRHIDKRFNDWQTNRCQLGDGGGEGAEFIRLFACKLMNRYQSIIMRRCGTPFNRPLMANRRQKSIIWLSLHFPGLNLDNWHQINRFKSEWTVKSIRNESNEAAMSNDRLMMATILDQRSVIGYLQIMNYWINSWLRSAYCDNWEAAWVWLQLNGLWRRVRRVESWAGVRLPGSVPPRFSRFRHPVLADSDAERESGRRAQSDCVSADSNTPFWRTLTLGSFQDWRFNITIWLQDYHNIIVLKMDFDLIISWLICLTIIYWRLLLDFNSALKLDWTDSKISLKLPWNCPETALKLLQISALKLD